MSVNLYYFLLQCFSEHEDNNRIHKMGVWLNFNILKSKKNKRVFLFHSLDNHIRLDTILLFYSTQRTNNVASELKNKP